MGKDLRPIPDYFYQYLREFSFFPLISEIRCYNGCMKPINRHIKVEFFHCPELLECDAEARLLFIGLWMLADREGRLEDRPKAIRALLFPTAKAEKIDGWLSQLASAHDERGVGLIVRYQTPDGEYYIWIPNLKYHQGRKTCQGRKSRIPPFDPAIHLHTALALPPAIGPTRSPTVITNKQIESIYASYPRKVGKRKALVAIGCAARRLAADGNDDPAERLLAATREYAVCEYVKSSPASFVPHPATWFNQDRFNDDRADWDRPAHISDEEIERAESDRKFKETMQMVHEMHKDDCNE